VQRCAGPPRWQASETRGVEGLPRPSRRGRRPSRPAAARDPL